MGKKNRKKKLTVYGCYEGDREGLILKFLNELYQPEKNDINVTLKHTSGGTPDRIVGLALKSNDRDKVFAWFDEDFEPKDPLGKETRERLAKCWNVLQEDKKLFFTCPLGSLQSTYNQKMKKPVLIVSQPVCVESFILKVLGRPLPFEKYVHSQREEQIEQLKNTVKNLIGEKSEDQFYKEKLTSISLAIKRTAILELDLLISMITKNK